MDHGYKILEHPSDVRVQAFGKTYEELFFNAMKGMNAVLKPQVKSPKSKVKNKIKIASVDLNALLVDFLSEVLYLIQTNKEIYDVVKFKKLGLSTSSRQIALEAELFGNKIESFGEDIKAVTHHDLKIEQKNGLYEAIILFDI